MPKAGPEQSRLALKTRFMVNRAMRIFVWLVSAVAAVTVNAGITFVPRHYYTTTYNSGTISQWREDGSLVGTLQLPTNVATDLPRIGLWT